MHDQFWNDCASNFTSKQSMELAAERAVANLTINGLSNRYLIGACFVEKWKENCICFPISDNKGEIYRAHCRSPKRNGAGKFDWSYVPEKDPHARPIPALVFGNPDTATKRLIFESQWDAISAIDKLDLFDEIDSGETALIMTRGAQFGARLDAFNWPEVTTAGGIATSAIAVYAFPQNDDAGRKWLASVIAATGGVYVVSIPAAHKDFGDWSKNGTLVADIEGAIDHAVLEVPATEDVPGVYKPARFNLSHSLAWYAQQAIDETQTLLGNRYLCRSGGMFAVAPSGMGKSTFSIQLAVLWCCGLVAFGIKPRKALRILIVQSEDDEGDCIEMARMVEHLNLTEDQRKMVAENTELIRCNDLCGLRFFEALRSHLAQAKDKGNPVDIVIINPFGVFLGTDPKDADKCTEFLNTWLNPLLSEFEVGAIIIHHTPKTNFRDTTNWKPSDWMYSGAGAAAMTNWARAYLAIDPTDTYGVYKFIAAKRGKRIGWGNAVPIFETFWAHSREEGQLLWLPADADQIALTKAASKKEPKDLLELIPLLDPILKEKLYLLAREKGFKNEKKTREFIKILENEGKIFVHKIRRPGVKSAIGYARMQDTDEEERLE